MDSIEMPLSIFNLEFTTKSKTSTNNSMLFALPVAQFWLTTMSIMAAKISTCQMYQLFSHVFHEMNITIQLYFYGI